MAYDNNYRPALWETPAHARAVSAAAAGAATIGLPTNVDERQLTGEEQSEGEIAERWRAAGCSEVVVKAGVAGCYYSGGDQEMAFASSPVEVIDSSGAGDAFNAGFLQSRLDGAEVGESIEAGQALARRTLGHLGAIEARKPTGAN